MHPKTRLVRRLVVVSLTVVLALTAAAPAFAVSGWDDSTLNAVSFSDANNGWVAGKWEHWGGTWTNYGYALSTADGGRTWAPRLLTSSPGSLLGFTALSFVSPTQGYLLGGGANATWATSNGGGSWSYLPLPAPGSGALDMGGLGTVRAGTAFTSASTGWAVGSRNLNGQYGVIYKTTNGGTGWSLQFEGPKYPEDGENPAPTTYARFEAVSVIPGTNLVIAVGKDERNGIATPLVMRTSNGTDWAADTLPASGLPTGQRLYGVKYLDANRAWAVGEGSGVYTFNGSAWSIQRTPSAANATLRAVDGVGASAAWAVGDNGTILKWNGSTWAAQASGVTGIKLLSVDFVDANRGWVVGEGKTILSTTNGGTTWTKWSPTTRLAGADRYATAVEISKDTFAAGSCQAAVLAYSRSSSAAFQDALMGSGLAGAVRGPLLLAGTSMTAGTEAELARVLAPGGAKKVYVLGVLPTTLDVRLRALGYDVVALRGKTAAGANDYYATGKLIATEIKAVKGGVAPTHAFVARGDLYADALSASALAAAKGFPVLLTPTASLPALTSSAITSVGIKNVVIAGGDGVVSTIVENQLKGLTVGGTKIGVVRRSGLDRWATATAVADHGVSQGWVSRQVVGIASGRNFPDALGGGVACGVNGGVLVLTEAGVLQPTTAGYLDSVGGGVFRLSVFGGTGVVYPAVLTAIAPKL